MKEFWSQLTFLSPQWLWLLAGLLLMGLLLGARLPAAPRVRFSSLRVLGTLGRSVRTRPIGVSFFLPLLALLAAILAMARPALRAPSGLAEDSQEGLDVVIALDVSASMDQPMEATISRLELSKQVIRDFINRRPNDRIGLVSFATHPYVLSPLTLSHSHPLRELEALLSEREKNARTAIGSAIAASSTRLEQRESRSDRLIILVTDGDNNAGRIPPLEAARRAATLGIRIYPVAIGQLSRDFDTLEKIAALTGGRAFTPRTATGFSQAFSEIDQLEKSPEPLPSTSLYQPIHLPLIAVSALLLISSIFYRSLRPPPGP